VPPAGYLTWQGIRQALQHLRQTYPALCELIELPERSAAGNRKIHAVRIGNREDEDASRRGVLLVGGTHARELVNPDLLVSFGLRLCKAYTDGTGLTYGGRSYAPDTIALLIDHLDLFLLPLLNPDGRDHVQKANGNPMWRKNRAAVSGSNCRGIDLNRNFDFLWPWTIGATSSQPCHEVFKGPSAASESEGRNAVWLLDTFPDIVCFVDVHSFGEMILYPWGDDDNQSADPDQNFQNPAFDGHRRVQGQG
jgi:carboxypeptidase T